MSHGLPDFDCHVRRDGDVATVSPRGELDLATVEAVEAHVQTALAARPARLVLDLSGLTFMASTGLQLVLRLVEQSSRDGFTLGVVPGPRQVQRVFEVTFTDSRVPWAGG